MSQANLKDQMAGKNNQQRPMEKDQTTTDRSRVNKKEMEVDWAHTQETSQLNHQASSAMEPSRKKESGKAKKHLAEKPASRNGH